MFSNLCLNFGNKGRLKDLDGLRPLQNSPKSPKCLGGNLGYFGEFCKGLNLCLGFGCRGERNFAKVSAFVILNKSVICSLLIFSIAFLIYSDSLKLHSLLNPLKNKTARLACGFIFTIIPRDYSSEASVSEIS